jgi:hypothetical protein
MDGGGEMGVLGIFLGGIKADGRGNYGGAVFRIFITR